MSEITDVVVQLKGWECDIISGVDAENTSGMAILEKRHILKRAADEVKRLRESIKTKNAEWEAIERRMHLAEDEVERLREIHTADLCILSDATAHINRLAIERDKYREALERIAKPGRSPGYVKQIAREALKE